MERSGLLIGEPGIGQLVGLATDPVGRNLPVDNLDGHPHPRQRLHVPAERPSRRHVVVRVERYQPL